MSYKKDLNMWEGYIYIIRNDIHPEKYYIGQTYVDLTTRWHGHVNQAKLGNHIYTDKIHNAMALYGVQHFALDILATYQKETKRELIQLLNEMERYYINRFNSYKNGYNSTEGGRDDSKSMARAVLQYDLNGKCVNKYESVDSLKEILRLDSVRSIYDCCLNHKCKYAYGYIWRYEGDDTPLPILSEKEKQEAITRYLSTQPIDEYDYKGNKLKQYKDIDALTKEYPQYKRSKFIKCCTGKIVYVNLRIYRFSVDAFDKYPTIRYSQRLIEQYDLDHNFIKVYNGAIDIEHELGINRGQIIYVCKHKGKTAGGYIWRYADDTTPFEDLDHNKHCKSVYQYDKQGNFIALYKSVQEASQATKIRAATISNNAKGIQQSIATIYVWSFKELTIDEVVAKTIPKTGKEVVQFDKEMNYIATFSSGVIAAKQFPDHKNAAQCIYNCCRGIKKSAYGYIWFYKDNPNCPLYQQAV